MNAPLRADAERNRQRLIAAAKDLFRTRGIDVTLDEVARHAGVGTGTAYRRFANKDELIDALMADRIAEIGQIAEECLEATDPWLGLTSFFERALALQAADRGLKQVLFSYGHGRERSNQARSRMGPPVTKLVMRAVEAGAVRADMATTDVPVINFMLSLVVDLGREVEPELYRRYLAILLDGLRRRDDLEPLPVDPLNVREFTEALARWKP